MFKERELKNIFPRNMSVFLGLWGIKYTVFEDSLALNVADCGIIIFFVRKAPYNLTQPDQMFVQ